MAEDRIPDSPAHRILRDKQAEEEHKRRLRESPKGKRGEVIPPEPPVIEAAIVAPMVTVPPKSGIIDRIATPPMDSPLAEASAALATTVFDGIPELLSKDDVRSMVEWLSGISPDKPAIMERLLTNLAMRLSWAMGFVMVDSLMRVQSLGLFMRKAEARLFDPDIVGTKSHNELLELYREAVRVQGEALEFVRKFVRENKDLLKDVTTEADALHKLLSEMSPQALEKFRRALRETS